MTLPPQTFLALPDWIAVQKTADWLTRNERADCDASPSARRRADRLAGRLAVKRLILDECGITPLMWEVGTDGVAPIGIGLSEDINISLSHSHGVGAAAWAQTRTQGMVGVDIQRIRPVHPGLAARILGAGETAESDEALLRLWAVKEAAIKARRQTWGRSLREMIVTDGFETDRFGTGTAQVWDGARTLTAAWTHQRDGWLARVLLPPQAI